MASEKFSLRWELNKSSIVRLKRNISPGRYYAVKIGDGGDLDYRRGESILGELEGNLGKMIFLDGPCSAEEAKRGMEYQEWARSRNNHGVTL